MTLNYQQDGTPVLEWEQIDDEAQRAKVYGGWLVRIDTSVHHMTDHQQGDGWDWRPAMCFVPDPKHEW